MLVAKIIGNLLILGGCSGLGIWYSMQVQRRIGQIKEMIRIFDLVISEMEYSHSTLPECCEKVGERAAEPYGSLFRHICREIQRQSGVGFGSICKQILGTGMEKMPLKEEKERFIQSFCDVGYGDAWMQRRTMERGRKELQDILDTEEKEVKMKSKMAVSLGTMSGILLVLILL